MSGPVSAGWSQVINHLKQTIIQKQLLNEQIKKRVFT